MYDLIRDTYCVEGTIRNIQPVDVRIYYENKKPYIDYVGEAIGPDNNKWTIRIPKIGLSFNEFKYKESKDCLGGLITSINFQACATHDEKVLFTITEREMTKEQIEKELGCKIKIKER